MQYFVYRHIRLDTNTVFYIGIGRKIENYNSFKSEYRRAFATRRNKYWCNIVNKIDYIIEIIFESDDYNFIKQKEKEFIKLYGRQDRKLGTLVNYTDGGEGTVGYKFNDEQLKRLSNSHKGQIPYMKGKKHTLDSKTKMSISHEGKHIGVNNNFYGKHHSLDVKIKMGTPIIQYDLNGNLINEYYSLTEASEKTNSDFRLIQKVCKGERNKHNGYKWSYKNKTRI